MAESGEERRLRAVPGEAAEERGSRRPGAGRAGAEGERAGGGRRLVLLLAVALAICAVLLASQVQRAGQLQARVTTLQDELATARGALDRYEQRMDEIRTDVGDLAARMQALEALVAEDPTAPAPAPTPGAAPEATPSPPPGSGSGPAPAGQPL